MTDIQNWFAYPFKIESAPGDKIMAEKLRAHLQPDQKDIKYYGFSFNELLESNWIDKSDEGEV